MDLQIKAQANNEAELMIYGYIGGWENRASEFAAQLKELKAKTLKVRINSGGGSLFDGVAIYNALKMYQGRIVVYIDALAASAASIIAMAGDERIMPSNTMLMIHNSISYADGNAKDFTEMAKVLSQLDEAMATTYVNITGQSTEKIREMMDKETWLSAKDALELGFATSVVDETKMSLSMNNKVALINGVEFNKVPDKMLALFKQPELAESQVVVESQNQSLINNKEPNSMNVEALKKDYPELCKQIEAAAYEQGKVDGVKADRGRIQAMEDIGIVGHDDLIKEAKFSSGISVEALAMQILVAEKAQRSNFIANRNADAQELEGILAQATPDNKSQESEFLAVFDEGTPNAK